MPDHGRAKLCWPGNRRERAEDYVYILAPPVVEHNRKESLEWREKSLWADLQNRIQAVRRRDTDHCNVDLTSLIICDAFEPLRRADYGC